MDLLSLFLINGGSSSYCIPSTISQTIVGFLFTSSILFLHKGFTKDSYDTLIDKTDMITLEVLLLILLQQSIKAEK